ncbi:MAG: hypothetical protein IKQ80_08520 [Clostridia bacterium]|nr:hypothetical protein [Clostridia bacterium]
MKQLISIIIVLMWPFLTCALASPCPLPQANTDVEIAFPGFDWYSDYNTVVNAAKERGFDLQWQDDYFIEGLDSTPHWNIVYSSLEMFANSQMNCGGEIYFYSVPDVAGYSVSQVTLYMMWNPDNICPSDYKTDNAAQLYMAVYIMDVTDTEACYNDLVSKLESIYGETSDKDIVEKTWGNKFSYWVNEDGGFLGINNALGVHIIYMAPGAEDKLVAVEEKVKEKEIENAKGDITGL